MTGNDNIRYRIFAGVADSLTSVDGYSPMAGVERYVLLDSMPEAFAIVSVAAHVVRAVERGNKQSFAHTKVHRHDHAELNVIMGQDSSLAYRYEIDGEEILVTAPSTVYIAPRVPHRMEPMEGAGVFLCIHLKRINP